MSHLEEKILLGVRQALENASAATLEYGALDYRGIGCNRRLPENNGIAMKPNPEGSFDGHTPVLRVRRASSPRQIIVVGHACHPTSSGPIGKWSPGYPGAMRDALEERAADTQAMFVQGCGADAKVVRRNSETGAPVFVADPEGAAAAGRKLAVAVRDLLQNGNLTSIPASLACALKSGELSYGPRWSQDELERLAYEGSRKSWLTWAARQHLAMPNLRRGFQYDVQVWRLGERLTLFGMEGEICSPYGPMLRSMAPTDLAMVVGYANCTAAYIPDAQILREGGYESDRSQHVYLLPARFTDNIETEVKTIARQALKGVGNSAD
jgi:hypothetical protein